MSNKTFFIILPIVIISLMINHKVYGNSNIPQSNVEIMRNMKNDYEKRHYSKSMAKYMYNRIKYYQEFDNWWDRQNAIWTIYEALQKEGL